MTSALPPTLEDLRQSPLAAWLWDGERGRIVWANRPGITAFAGQSLFDLVDRPFDRAEPGVERIAEMTRNLARGDSARAELSFPSTGQTQAFHCRCHIHALADGRAGLLAVAEPPAVTAAALAPDLVQSAFEHMAMPALLMGRDGSFLGLNGEARALAGGRADGFAALLGDEAQARELVARLAATATVSEVAALATRVGRRDIRLTLQRLAEGQDAPILLLMDDVTDRRQLERQMDVAPPVAGTPLAEAEAKAFETLGHQINHALVRRPAAPEAAAPVAAAEPPPPPAPRRQAATIPAILTQAMDRLERATFIIAGDGVAYINRPGLAATGHATMEEAINDAALWALLTGTPSSGPVAAVLDNGQRLSGCLEVMKVAWQGGPARQLVFTADRNAPVMSEPVPAPQPAVVPDPFAAAAAPVVDPFTAPPPLSARAEPHPALDPFAGPQPGSPDAGADPRPDPFAPPAEPAAARPVPELNPFAAAGPATPAIVIPAPLPEPPVPSATADDELRAILDTVADGIITLDAKGHIHTFSAGAEAIFGYRLAEVVDRPLADLLTPDSRKVLNAYLASLDGPGLASVFNDGREVTAVVRQGGEVPLFLTVGLLQSPRSLASFCAVVRDITQWKRSEADLREARDRAEEVSRQKSDFLAHISHELRTPLNAIMGFSDAMQGERFGPLNDKYRAYAHDIHESGGHLLSLINDLLDLSRVEAGKLELNFTSVDLAAVTDHGLRMLQEPAAVARVVMRRAFAEGLPPVVADLRAMRQIIINLLSNAIKFTEPGGQVIVAAELLPSGELALRVKDTGIGMSAKDLKAALEPFARVETEGRGRQGTGLGLPLTKALTEANRARFEISSEPRKGTLVEVIFPTTRVLAE